MEQTEMLLDSAKTKKQSSQTADLKETFLQTPNIADVIPFINEESWLLVDLDNCLFEGAQALGHANWFYDELQQRMDAGMSREEATGEIYPSWIELQKVCKVKPLEYDFIPTLKMLQGKGIPIMGLTHRQPILADFTVRQVHSLDFTFLATAPSKETFSIPAPSPTLYLQGILFVGDYNKKVDLFEHFINIPRVTPRRVVFMDDKRDNVQELSRLTQRGIEYVGIHYTAIEEAQPIYQPDISAIQLKFFDQILSNEAAMLLKEHGIEE